MLALQWLPQGSVNQSINGQSEPGDRISPTPQPPIAALIERLWELKVEQHSYQKKNSPDEESVHLPKHSTQNSERSSELGLHNLSYQNCNGLNGCKKNAKIPLCKLNICLSLISSHSKNSLPELCLFHFHCQKLTLAKEQRWFERWVKGLSLWKNRPVLIWGGKVIKESTEGAGLKQMELKVEKKTFRRVLDSQRCSLLWFWIDLWVCLSEMMNNPDPNLYLYPCT